MERKIIITKDNSKTLLIPEMNETYHSTHGAIAESQHIYIEHGLTFFNNKKTVDIFEMGFGTGLNAILTLNHALKQNILINYHTIEKFPVTIDEIRSLDYINTLQLNDLNTEFLKLHHSKMDKTILINRYFNFLKQQVDLKTIQLDKNKYDLIYFDAFAPQHQPDLWTIDVLQKMYDCLKPNGFLITYCAQGQFKRNLKLIGFKVIPLPGPVGKREITKALKIQ